MMPEIELDDGTILEFPYDMDESSILPIVQSFDKFRSENGPNSHELFVNPLHGVTESFAQGVYEAPGQLAGVVDALTRGPEHTGQTLQEQVNEAVGVNDLGYSPEEYGASPLLQSLSRLTGNVVGDPLNALPIGMVSKAGAVKGADNLMKRRPDKYFRQKGSIGRNVDKNLYHVADNYDGLDLESLYDQFGDDAYDIYSNKWPDAGELSQYHAQQIHLHNTLDEARRYKDKYGGEILSIDPDGIDIRIDDLEYPHPVARKIPKENISIIDDLPMNEQE